MRYSESIHNALRAKLAEDEKVILLGEDIADPYGGSFKITKGLSTAFPGRVLNTPMSEAALAGVAGGMALRGLKPVLEIMFGDFLTLCADQMINHAAKFRWMYNDQVRVPLVIRAPMGGYRAYGPTHSQTLEKMFLGFPGFSVIAPSHWHDPGALLIRAIDDPDPVLFIENKFLYSQTIRTDRGDCRPFDDKRTGNPFPTLLLSMCAFQKADLTLVAYGGLTALALEAACSNFMTAETCSELVIPSALQPLDPVPILESAERSGRLVVLDEASPGYGFASEIAALVAQTPLIAQLKAPVQLVTAKNVPIGCAAGLEASILPSLADVLLAMQKVLGCGIK